MIATGILKRINAKSGTSAKGPWTAYSICVGPAGNNDNDTWYRLGFEKPNVNEGSVVKFDFEEDARGNKKVQGEILVDKGATEQAAKAAKSSGGGHITHDARQSSIVRQNATTTATAIVGMMFANGIIKAPPKKADGYDFTLAMITEVADHLFPTLISPPTIEELAQRAVGEADADPEPFEDDLDKAFENDDDKWVAA